MSRALAAVAIGVALSAAAGATARPVPPPPQSSLTADIDRILDTPVLAHALVAARIELLQRADGSAAPAGSLLYARNPDTLVMPASNLKLLTLAVAADRLGWDFRYDTRLEAAGSISGGTLHGDLIVVGGGDPSIAAQDFGASALFSEWAAALAHAGIRRVDGRLIGDDTAFDEQGWGAGWAWDYLGAGYAAPSGALSYNENVAVVRAWPGAAAGDAVRVELSPPGHSLDVANELTTGEPGSDAAIEFVRRPGSSHLTIRGHLPAGGPVAIRTTAVDNPTRFFVEGLRLALAAHGIVVRDGASDIHALATPMPAAPRRLLAQRESLPLSSLAGYFVKVSQNFYAETLLKTIGRAPGVPGSAEAGGRIVRDTLTNWGIPGDAFVMADGSGLSRYNFVTATTMVEVLTHAWRDERLRGPFVAALPVGGRDGTLESRMRGTALDGRVQAKTGIIDNVRALSGYVIAASGDRIVFSIIVNNFTAPASEIDAIVERVLRAVDGGSSLVPVPQRPPQPARYGSRDDEYGRQR